MAEDDQATAVSRFGWFSAGALAVLITIAVFHLGRDLFQSAQVEGSTPPVIIEAP